MAYKPPSQTVIDDEVSQIPSSEAVFEALKLKADVDLQNISITGEDGDVLTLSSGVPVWAAPSGGGGGGGSLPSQTGNSGKFLSTDGSDAFWDSVSFSSLENSPISASGEMQTSLSAGGYRIDPNKYSYTHSASGSYEVNWENGTAQVLTLDASITSLTMINPIEGGSFVLKLIQGSSGNNTVSWPATVKWGVGSQPILSTASGQIDIISLIYLDSEYYGTYALGFQ